MYLGPHNAVTDKHLICLSDRTYRHALGRCITCQTSENERWKTQSTGRSQMHWKWYVEKEIKGAWSIKFIFRLWRKKIHPTKKVAGRECEDVTGMTMCKISHFHEIYLATKCVPQFKWCFRRRPGLGDKPPPLAPPLLKLSSNRL